MSKDIKKNLFWGLVLEPGKRYDQEVRTWTGVHVSKACVEPQSVEDGGITSVYLKKEGGAEEFILCSLSSKEVNKTLDLNFGYGEKVCFRTSGPGRVHLSGYLLHWMRVLYVPQKLIDEQVLRSLEHDLKISKKKEMKDSDRE